MRNLMLKVGAAMMVATMIGCGSSGSAGGGAGGGGVSGSLTVDGSSTVFPITQGLAEEFMKVNEGANITVNESGTGSGMKKFVAGEIDICDASRPTNRQSAVWQCGQCVGRRLPLFARLSNDA